MSEQKRSRPVFGGLEISVLAGVLGFILYAIICVPNLNYSRRSPAIACINNLRIIDAAKQQWALEHGVKDTNTWVAEADITPYIGRLGKFPKCPTGGIYTIGRLNEVPTCSIGGLHILKE